MVIEKLLAPFSEWIGPALAGFGISVAVLMLIVLAFGCLVMVIRYGPAVGIRATGKVIAGAVPDLLRMSPRRVWALAWLAVKESLSRRIVVVFLLFVLLLLFAAWFLDPTSVEPGRLYLGFVLTASNFLVLALALLLSAFSLPGDIKNKSIYTVVTKPVRASEVVLGRMLGFIIVGTILLGVMSVVSLVFVVRGLAHTHEVVAGDLRRVETRSGGSILTGYTKHTNNHRHRVTIDQATSQGVAEAERRHVHAVELGKDGGHTSGQEGMLTAKVPYYGKIRFRDDAGLDTEQGICVGDEWTYRSFISGNSKAAAVWEFSGVTPDRFHDSLTVEMNIGVFRSYKGDMARGVLGSLSVRNPRTGLTANVKTFESKEFTTFQVVVPQKLAVPSVQYVSRKIDTGEGFQYTPALNDPRDESLLRQREFDLYKDFVADGKVELWLQCVDGSQYFGAAQPDLYLRMPDAPFWLNFFKGYYGIWLQMVLVIGFGVMFSTFLSGAVASLATVGVMVGGFFNEMLLRLATGKYLGGAMVEAVVRLLRQDNLTSPLPEGIGSDVVRIVDQGIGGLMYPLAWVMPPFDEFGFSEFVASGYDIAWNPWIVVSTLRALGYLLPVFVAGYFFLKTREVAR